MTRMILTNAQWELMEPHCLGKKSDPGRTGRVVSRKWWKFAGGVIS